MAVSDRTKELLTVYYQHVGGMNTSLSEYSLACSDDVYDLYAFTETWLSDLTLSKQIFSSNYTVYRQDRSPLNSSKRSGGGVLLALRSCYKSDSSALLVAVALNTFGWL